MVMIGNGSSKHAFWQALLFTIVIFGIGLIAGYFLENSRASEVELNLLNSEVNLLDEQLRSSLITDSNISCDIAVKSTFDFADKIYDEAQKLEKYDSVAKFNRDTMIVLHKRYDILRMVLWDESISLKNRCGGFHTVVYFFDYDPQDLTKRAEQGFFARLLVDAKERDSGKILLIPIAGNLDLASIDLAINSYNITKTPSILIDENRKVDSILTFDEFENIIFQK